MDLSRIQKETTANYENGECSGWPSVKAEQAVRELFTLGNFGLRVLPSSPLPTHLLRGREPCRHQPHQVKDIRDIGTLDFIVFFVNVCYKG